MKSTGFRKRARALTTQREVKYNKQDISTCFTRADSEILGISSTTDFCNYMHANRHFKS